METRQRPKKLTITLCKQIYGESGAILKLDSRCMVCKAYFSINSNLLLCKNWKHDLKISNTSLIWLRWVKVLFLKKLLFFQKMETSTILRATCYWKVYFLNIDLCVYTGNNFHVPCMILMSFRQGEILPSCTTKRFPENSTQIRVKLTNFITEKFIVKLIFDYTDVMHDKPLTESFTNKIELVQYNTTLVIAVEIKRTSRECIYK